MRNRVILAAVVVLAVAGICTAGMELSFKCRKCNLQDKVGVGGGFEFEEIPCFCTNSNHFVSVTWKRGESAPEPKARDKGVAIYVCPECMKTTARQWDRKTCPKCGSKKVEIKFTGLLCD